MSGQLYTHSCQIMEQYTPTACFFPPPASTELLRVASGRVLLTMDIPQPLKGSIRGSWALCDRNQVPPLNG